MKTCVICATTGETGNVCIEGVRNRVLLLSAVKVNIYPERFSIMSFLLPSAAATDRIGLPLLVSDIAVTLQSFCAAWQ